MKHLVVLSALALVATLSACGGTTKKSCKDTACPAGSTCNGNTGLCEIVGSGGGSGGGGGGGTTGGGGGTTGGGGGTTGGGGGTTGGGGGGGGLVVDPFDDGGVFVAGDICGKALPVSFDGGTTATVTVDLATFQDQYLAGCNSSTSGNDVVFELNLPQAKTLVVSATDTSGKNQDAVIALIQSPCPMQTELACVDTTSDPEVLTVTRVPAGTWYVLLENYADDATGDGTYDVQFELRDPPPQPMNDTCATATPITLTNGTATVMGTTTGAGNDTAGSPLTCSSASATTGAEVFYTLTLAQPQDVTVTLTTPTGSNLSPVMALTNTCGMGGMGNERACRSGTSTPLLARNLPAGTYTLVVDGTDADSGDFSFTVTTSPPVPPPANDTCSAPLTLVPNVSQSIDVNTGNLDYPPSCRTASGGDAVYQFTLAQAQPVRITATGMMTGTVTADAVISLFATNCGASADEVDCIDAESSAPEVLETTANLPAGTYYVTVAAYSSAAGQFGLSLELLAPISAPSNDTCSTPQMVTFTGGTASAMLDLRAAAVDFTSLSCSPTPDGGDAVYQVEIPVGQTLTVEATPDTNFDVVLAAITPTCTTTTNLSCVDATSSGGVETLTVQNTTGMSMTVFVVVKGYDLASMGTTALTFTLQ